MLFFQRRIRPRILGALRRERSSSVSTQVSPAPLLTRADLPWISAAVLAAVGLRLLWIAYVNVDPDDGRFADAVFFHNVARLLADGWGYVEPYGRTATAQWPPGYPAALAVLYKLFGFHLVLAKGLNLAFAAITVFVTYLIGGRIFDRRVAYIGALIFAFFPGQIYFSTLVMAETMFAMVFVLVLLLALVWTIGSSEARWWQLLLIGVLIGVSAMVRAEGVFLGVVLVALWALLVRPWPRMARYSAVAALGAVLALSPWTIRNAVEFHEFMPLRVNAGRTIARGLDPEAISPRIFQGFNSSLSEGLQYQSTHPWQIPNLVRRRVARLYSNDSDAIRFIRDPGVYIVDQSSVAGSNDVQLSFRRRTPLDGPPQVYLTDGGREFWRGLADRYFLAAGAAALVAMAVCLFKRERSSMLLIFAAVGWTLLFGFIPPATRYHFALGPVVAILAGAFVVFAWDGAAMGWRWLLAKVGEARADGVA